MRLTLLAVVLLVPLALHAEPPAAVAADPAATVKGYFAALGKNDFKRALALTSGTAQTRTENMVGTLNKQAAAAHARVELRVRRVLVSEPAGQLADGLPVSVEVQFEIDVVGRRWIFSRVARKLTGRAQFYVACDLPRIVAIEGKIE